MLLDIPQEPRIISRNLPADAKKARELGAEGIGLCRTEHMFFDPERIAAFREMICSDTVEERETALNKLLNVSLLCRNELMKRWIKETDCYWTSLKSLV